MSNFQFGTSIPNSQVPRRHESSSLKPTRDSDATARQWLRDKKIGKNMEAVNNNVSKIYRELGRRRPKIFDTNAFPMHAFKLYNVPQENCPPKDVPNDYDPAVDAYRTFRVRGGVVGMRSIYNGPTASAWQTSESGTEYLISSASVGGPALFGTDGNARDTSGSFEYFPFDESTYDYPSGSETVVYVGNTGDFGPLDGVVTFVLDKTVDDVKAICAAFWIEVYEHSGFVSPYAAVKCRMFTGNPAADSTSRTNNPFPTETTRQIIPIGITTPLTGFFPASLSLTKPFVTQQILTGNPVNRFAAAYPGLDGGNNGMVFRGPFSSGKFYYPGDLVSDAGNHYIHIGYAVETSAPTAGASWLAF